jgi:hypothetical protein
MVIAPGFQSIHLSVDYCRPYAGAVVRTAIRSELRPARGPDWLVMESCNGRRSGADPLPSAQLRIIHYGGASVGRLPIRRGGRAVECTGLENRRPLTGTVGSNPTLSAIRHINSRRSRSDHCDSNEAGITPVRAAPKGRGAKRRVIPPSPPNYPSGFDKIAKRFWTTRARRSGAKRRIRSAATNNPTLFANFWLSTACAGIECSES